MTKQQAAEYVEAVSRSYDAQPCQYGHFGCALTDGGPCSDELTGLHHLNDDDGSDGNPDMYGIIEWRDQ